jgi:hypothetical protein
MNPDDPPIEFDEAKHEEANHQFSNGSATGASTSKDSADQSRGSDTINVFPTVHDAVVMAESKDNDNYMIRL